MRKSKVSPSQFPCLGNRLCLCLLILLAAASLPPLQATELQLQEVSRFAFSSHDMATYREPVIQYPYIYMPNSYGFQVCLWDSLANTFTEIANYGVAGSVNEIRAWQQYLFLAVSYNHFEDMGPDTPALYRVDISDPWHPQAAGFISAGEGLTKYGNLHVVNNTLLAHKEQYGMLTGLVLIDPAGLGEIGFYPPHYRFEVIRDQFVITRPQSTNHFSVFAVNPATGLEALGSISLPHYAINTFPLIFDRGDNIVATQCGEGIKLWDTSDILNWQLLSEISHPFSARGVFSGAWLVGANYEVAQNVTRFYIYDIADLTNPVLTNACDYPSGLDYPPGGVERITTHGSFLFHCCMNQGCVCLRLETFGAMSFVARCYRFSLSTGHARKYGNFVLRGFYSEGLACFDISNPQNPSYAFTLFAGNTVRMDINGDFMLALVQPNDHGAPSARIYNISDTQNPQLVSSFPHIQGTTVFFNYEEPLSFYRLDNASNTLQKYTITNNVAFPVLSYNVPEDLFYPTFVNGLLHLSRLTAEGYLGELYIYSGFPDNEPQAPVFIPQFFGSSYLDMYNAGEYAFVRTIHPAIPALFYNSASTLRVKSDIFGFNFRNYVCIGHQTGVSFYDYSNAAGTYVWHDADLFVPQFSYPGHIDWDDDFLYLSCNDHVVIYAYDLNSDNGDVTSPAVARLNCYPNPFSRELQVRLDLKEAGHCSLDVYNLRGQLVRHLHSGLLPLGEYATAWDGQDGAGKRLAAGIYLIRATTPSGRETRKLLLHR